MYIYNICIYIDMISLEFKFLFYVIVFVELYEFFNFSVSLGCWFL